MKRAKREKIRDFLLRFKKAVACGHGLYVIPRRENLEALSMLGLTKKNQRDIIMSLSLVNYCEGPEPDKDRGGHIWIFGTKVDEKEIYIKLKLAKVGKKMITKCLSFHIAKYPLTYPYDRKTKERGHKK